MVFDDVGLGRLIEAARAGFAFDMGGSGVDRLARSQLDKAPKAKVLGGIAAKILNL